MAECSPGSLHQVGSVCSFPWVDETSLVCAVQLGSENWVVLCSCHRRIVLLTVLLLWSSLLVGHVFIVLVRHFSLPPWIKYHSIAFLRWCMAFFGAMVQRGKVWKVRWKFSLIRNLQIFQRHFLLLVRFARSALWALVSACKCHEKVTT